MRSSCEFCGATKEHEETHSIAPRWAVDLLGKVYCKVMGHSMVVEDKDENVAFHTGSMGFVEAPAYIAEAVEGWCKTYEQQEAYVRALVELLKVTRDWSSIIAWPEYHTSSSVGCAVDRGIDR